MDFLLEIAIEVLKVFTKIFLYFFVEILFEFLFKYVLFNLGYFTLKVITLSNFPKDREKAEALHTEIAVLGVFILIVGLYVLFIKL